MTEKQVQLSFEIGGAKPDTAVVKLSGVAHVHRELAKGEEIHMQVVDADGAVVADGYGKVVQIAFKDHYDEAGNVTATERIHTVKVS